MLSRTTKDFRDLFRRLPQNVQAQAETAYQLWLDDPWHSSLDFKQVTSDQTLYSARVGMHWRVVGFRNENTMVWFWIGSHAKYDRLLAQFG